MREWVLATVLMVGCGSPDAGELLPPEEPSSAESEAKVPKVRTICADEVARELDPHLDELVADALLYWQDQPGVEVMRHAPGEDCDIPVYFSDESRWEGDQAGRAYIKGDWEPGCRPQWLELREAKWQRMNDLGWAPIIIMHEMGHLLCLDHAEHGVMRFDGALGGT